MKKDNLIDKPKEWQWPLQSMSAPHFLTAKRQSLLCRCFCCFGFLPPAPMCMCPCLCTYVCVCVCVPCCCCGGTVARTNHYLVVAGLERSAVWNVRLCSTGARCSRAPLKCPIKEGRVRFEWVRVRGRECACVREMRTREQRERRVLLVLFALRASELHVKYICTRLDVCEHTCKCKSFLRVANERH